MRCYKAKPGQSSGKLQPAANMLCCKVKAGTVTQYPQQSELLAYQQYALPAYDSLGMCQRTPQQQEPPHTTSTCTFLSATARSTAWQPRRRCEDHHSAQASSHEAHPLKKWLITLGANTKTRHVEQWRACMHATTILIFHNTLGAI